MKLLVPFTYIIYQFSLRLSKYCRECNIFLISKLIIFPYLSRSFLKCFDYIMRIFRELILEQRQKLFSSKNDSILFYWITIDRFSIILQTSNTHFLHFIQFRKIQFHSLFLFLSKKAKRKGGKRKEIKRFPVFSPLFQEYQ